MDDENLTLGKMDPAQLLFIGIHGTAMSAPTKELLEEVRPGGVILFKRNVEGLSEVAALCDDIRSCTDAPTLLAIDEEGGRVSRLAPHISELPDAYSTSSLPPAELREYWKRYGTLLAGMGFDMNFAPVVDLCPPDAPNGIADRAYGTDADTVIACARQVLEGLADSGLVSTLKHFPGLGHTLLDSHHHLPTIQKSQAELESEDLRPYMELGDRVPAIMIGHGHYPFYSGAAPVAATLSREISTDLLRTKMGYRGVAISDDLEMKAVAARVPWEELACRAVESGNDMLLICHDAERIRSASSALRERAGKDESFAIRCAEALGRVSKLRHAVAQARQSAGREKDSLGAGQIAEDRARLLECASAVPVARI
jgi:beta-N-acetylhexosaminidase